MSCLDAEALGDRLWASSSISLEHTPAESSEPCAGLDYQERSYGVQAFPKLAASFRDGRVAYTGTRPGAEGRSYLMPQIVSLIPHACRSGATQGPQLRRGPMSQLGQ